MTGYARVNPMVEPPQKTPTGEHPVAPASPVYLTKAEAIERVTESESTVKKYLREGRFPNAEKDSQGQWRIPASDLAGAGLTLIRPGMQPPQKTPDSEPAQPTVTLTLHQYDTLKTAAGQAQVLRELAAEAQRRADFAQHRVIELEAATPAATQTVDLTEQPRPIPQTWREWRRARKAVKRAN